ncbi:glutaredoxin family protein [Thermoclostridium caenicola]|uniref:Glutaredoxin n=1 Tax=Thermoclostridium caenicola TaxID=659425 RepID=A0A1M6E4G9_9FIRM|nr:glutaredoxin [Thermoclostridium caenicola]SHI80341.1 Glutaredoxin [Thermoclostridium caenicola]
MKRVTMFKLPGCPYCKQAEEYLKNLMEKNPEYRAVEIERIDETARPDIADQYDYWYVPAFYIGREKLHEGVPTLEKVEAVLKAALK